MDRCPTSGPLPGIQAPSQRWWTARLPTPRRSTSPPKAWKTAKIEALKTLSDDAADGLESDSITFDASRQLVSDSDAPSPASHGVSRYRTGGRTKRSWASGDAAPCGAKRKADSRPHPADHRTDIEVESAAPGTQSPRSLSEGCSSGRRPSGQWNKRSAALIGISLMLAWRSDISPSSANSQFSLP